MSTRLEPRTDDGAALLLIGGALVLTGIAIGWFGRTVRPREDPVLRAARQAPLDDEPLTAEEEAAIAEGRAAARRGEVTSWRELRRRRRAGAVPA